MIIEAPISKFKKQNWMIAIAALIIFGLWCVYDGYINEDWIAEHTSPEGEPETYLLFNMYAPFIMIPLAIMGAIYLYIIRDKKLIAGEQGLDVEGKETITYDSIEKIDKTHFESKGYFVLTYKDENGKERTRKFSDRRYDNLGILLDHLVSEIS